MNSPLKGSRAALRRARELLLERGELPLSYAVPPLVARSWRRSAAAGLTPMGRLPEAAVLDARQLAHATEHHQELLNHARPVMAYLHGQTRDSGSMVILADERGVVLQTLGDADFLDRAERVLLVPGALWDERHRGTNGIGTALAEARPLAVQGGEHYLERNGFLSCAAAPVMAPDGRLLGVLDISGEERQAHPHTLGLVRTAAQMLEHRLFLSLHQGSLKIRFHPLAQGLGGFDEGLAALSETGAVLGATPAGFQYLGLAAADLGHTPLERVLQVRLSELLAWQQRHPGEPLLVQRNDGSRLFLSLEAGAGRRIIAGPGGRPNDALAALDSGDPVWATAIAKARRLFSKPGAPSLLLQGEAGVGKSRLARACHGASLRSHGPWVAIHRAAPHEVEADLFGIPCQQESAFRRAHGGSLFIDRVETLSPLLQIRLLAALENVPADFNLICTCEIDLAAASAEGRFDADLLHHLAGLTLILPPLRQRSDFPALLQRMLAEVADHGQMALEPAPDLSPDVAAALADFPWPGNLRQLSRALAIACALLEPGERHIGWQHLPDDLVKALRAQPQASDEAAAPENLRALSEATTARAIALAHGNMSEAARRLGISRNTLYRHLKKVGG